MEKIIIALGGNALQERGMPPTAETQIKVTKKTSEHIVDIVMRGHEIGVVHGNGPQVGEILLAFEQSKTKMPFDACGAMSQGYIGYHLQQALVETLKRRGKKLPVVSLVTQVVVDENDNAFKNPTKPIGSFYTKEEALKIQETKGYTMVEDSGRGWRRVVPSPIPVRIIEVDTVKQLWSNTIVIAAGGGGIPVIEDSEGYLEGVAAVIDKDFAAAKMAEDLDADILLIMTEVEHASLNYGKSNQVDLGKVTVSELDKYIEEGHFAEGSMLPKILAAKKFVESGFGKKAIITSLYKGVEALDGKTGTVIT